MVCLDIGAHLGFYSLLASRKVGATGKVVAFEPAYREYTLLRRHLRLNRCTNMRAERLAVGSHEGEATLFIVQGETGLNSLRPPAVAEPVQPVTVPVITLDQYVEQTNLSLIDLVKIDVEGAELDVLKGSVEILRRCPRPVIMAEVQDVRTAPWGYQASAIYDFLAARRYRWFSVTMHGKLYARPRTEHFDENLVAIPQERLHRLQELLGCRYG